MTVVVLSVHFSVDDAAVDGELARLAAGPAPFIGDFDGVLLQSFQATEAHVHVITGALKASGAPSSSFDGDRWEGTISYARHPGIFELARGNSPTQNHPEGDHFFFDPPEGSEYYRQRYEAVFYDFLGATGHGVAGLAL